ncbi:MAG TPA: T9SS type A sorting domain-containing protein [Cyclobacteriaceae bacterium]|nr:T9SS type A sorting domain-containing protein [Cyclobacteriaceae bacterium]
MFGSLRALTSGIILTLLSFNLSFSQTADIIHYDSGYSWRGYNGTEAPLCPTRLCHRYSMCEWDSYYTESTIWKSTNGQPGQASAFLNFRIIFPPGYNIKDNAKKYPAIIMLHGAGESGRVWAGNFNYGTTDPKFDNNSTALQNGGNEHRLAVAKAASAANAFPGIVVFPQASYSGAWDDASSTQLTQNEEFIVRLIEDYLVPRYHADINRITMHGLSAGATGTWGFAQKRPDLFAAILPMSGVPHDLADATSKLVTTPIRMFQGGLDTNPRPSAAQEVIDAFEAEGGIPRLYLYPDLEHNTWDRAYSEPDFFSWIVANNKRNVYAFDNKTVVCPGVDSIRVGFSANMKSYQWTRNSYNMPRGTERYFYITDPGSYKLKFTRPNNEVDESYTVNIGLKAGCKEREVVVVVGVGEESSDMSPNSIYPNPATDRIYITNIQSEDPGFVHIVSASGQVIHVPVAASAEGKAELNISGLDPGVYVVRTGLRSFKFVKGR